MRITKRQLKRIIKEEKAKLLSEQPGQNPPLQPGLERFEVRMVIDVAAGTGDIDYVMNSVEDGMDFDEASGEGIVDYSMTPMQEV
jgi:hypothetical protein